MPAASTTTARSRRSAPAWRRRCRPVAAPAGHPVGPWRSVGPLLNAVVCAPSRDRRARGGSRPSRPPADAGTVLRAMPAWATGVPRRDRGRMGHDGAEHLRHERDGAPRRGVRRGRRIPLDGPERLSRRVHRSGDRRPSGGGRRHTRRAGDHHAPTRSPPADPVPDARPCPAGDDAVPLRPDFDPVPCPGARRRHVHRPRRQRVSVGRRRDCE
jgi:hypothetical protein